ncbi:MAG: Rdx family protein [Candidatus Obscuribacterales bacterium]|nr:Rdx family protein [Candidatus Obscuribacterales bacterium]
MAAEIEDKLDESSKLFQSSGGVFEIEYKGQLIFSKKATGRFPEDGEVLRVVANLEQGMSLQDAQSEAAKGIPQLPSFFEWLNGFMARRGAQKGS